MSRSDLVAFAGFAILCVSYGVAPEYAVTTTLVAALVGVMAAVHHRDAARARESMSASIVIGASTFAKVSADGPEAFLLGVREDESGEPFAYCTGECPNPEMEVAIGLDGTVDTPSGARRATFAIDGRIFVVAHRRAGAFPDGIRAESALESLRAVEAFGPPSVTIGAGRMEVRVEGTTEPAAREALLTLARIVHRLAHESGGQTTERGVYR